MKTRQALRWAAMLVPMLTLVVILAGCLISEIDEYFIRLNDDGKSGIITVIKRNIQSDQTEVAKQREDFDELVRDWRGDSYLLEKTEQGVYVKDRQLWVEKGKLTWKEISVFSDFRRLFHDVIRNDTVRLVFGKDEIILDTNGDVVQTRDSTIVMWPMKTREFVLKVQKKNFPQTSDFASKFRELTKKKKK